MEGETISMGNLERRLMSGFFTNPKAGAGIVQERDGSVYVIDPDGTRKKLHDTLPVSSIKVVDFVADLGGEGVAFSTSGKDQEAFKRAAEVKSGAYIYFRPGVYMAHEIPVTAVSRFLGDGRLNTAIFYNGQGGPGSCLFDVSAPGALGSVEFYGLKLQGYANGMSGTGIAENVIRHGPSSGIDWGHRIERCLLAYCFGDAFYAPHGLVNCYLRDLRFDTVGGYPISITGDASMERRAFHLQDFTYDNAIGGTFANVASREGHYDGVRWGRGFMRVRDCVDTTFHVQDGRIEFNKRLTVVDKRCSAFHSSMSIQGFQTLEIDNVKGFWQLADAGVFIHAPGGRTLVSLDGYSGMSGGGKGFEDGTNRTADIVSGGPFFGATSMRGLPTAARGILVDAQRLEWRDAPPASGNHTYQRGDVIFNSKPGPGQPPAWSVTAPVAGFGRADRPTHTTAAVVTAGSAVVTVPATSLRLLPVGAAITLVGMKAGADLDAVVVDIDVVSSSITVDQVPSSSSQAATIRQRGVTFTPWPALAA